MTKTIWAIARNTFRETIRDRILYSLVAFAVVVIAASLLAGSVSLGQEVRVIQNFGLTAMLVFLLIITVFIGTQLVYREIERKTVYMLLSKPVSRDAFYLGKFVGLSLTIAAVTAIMGTAFIALVALKTHSVAPIQVMAIVMMMLEAWLLTAVGMLFSAFTAPLSSAIYTLCLALIGHASTALLAVALKGQPAIKYILEFIYYVFPNLEKFNLRNEVVFGAPIDWSFVGWGAGYAVVYTAALLLLGVAVIRKYEV